MDEARAILEGRARRPSLDSARVPVSPYDVARVALPKSNGARVDLRDLVIYQQSLHIHELEQELCRYRSRGADETEDDAESVSGGESAV
ncbi:hypothetical protein G1C95_0482 [Bifidobacterium sp. DSM 109957]|uniref:Uncharacterized protein n=2 Tax=Bifidobacterium oedipodis TaxID=2675322 RepID=A0A7Y0EN50_9BIFI|nr:hypothetical protein [Bifidobacterium sp. DSM 109957]